MPNKKVSKFVKRWRNERKQRRLENAGDELWKILEGKNPREKVALFSKQEKIIYFSKLGAFGTIMCPVCGKAKTFVSNPAGVDGNPDQDFVMTHLKFRGSSDCDANGMLLKNLFKSTSVL